jgi:hypothetical protein
LRPGSVRLPPSRNAPAFAESFGGFDGGQADLPAVSPLFVINLLTSPAEWWVQWAALGIGIAWVISLVRVVPALVLAGGLAALGLYLSRRR